MDRETAWRMIGAVIYNGTAPAPETVRIQAHSIHIEAFTCSDVDRWAAYLEMPKPRVIMNHSYGTVEFYGGGSGWLGADVISVSCEKPSEVDRMKEEMTHGNERESVAA